MSEHVNTTVEYRGVRLKVSYWFKDDGDKRIVCVHGIGSNTPDHHFTRVSMNPSSILPWKTPTPESLSSQVERTIEMVKKKVDDQIKLKEVQYDDNEFKHGIRRSGFNPDK